MNEKRKLARIAVMCLMCCFLCGCGKLGEIKGIFKESKPEDTVKSLERALNKGDVEKILDCCSSDVAKAVSGGGTILGSLAGKVLGDALGFDIDMEAAADLVMGLWGMSGDLREGYAIHLEVTDIDYEGDENCLVYVSAEVSDDAGHSEIENLEMPMLLEDGEWKVKITLHDLGLE